ncbi:hypothetical protein K501DRAFT_33980 [Backusella circina FSU 941]|nr:hypothetical protein K501DRAFT_33980 [Backusella circina FSU 941]
MVGQMFFALIQDKAPQRTWLFLISVGELKDAYSVKTVVPILLAITLAVNTWSVFSQ